MSGFSVMTMEAIKTLADKLRCSVEVADANELQFDLDSDTAYETFEWFYEEKLQPRFKGGLTMEEWRSKGGNRHVVVTLPQDLRVEDRIVLQALGGSDIGREFAALCCHWDGSPHPILLFRPLPVPISLATGDVFL
jgi:hypothetical protein